MIFCVWHFATREYRIGADMKAFYRYLKRAVTFIFNNPALQMFWFIYGGEFYGTIATESNDDPFITLWTARNTFFFKFPAVLIISFLLCRLILRFRRSAAERASISEFRVFCCCIVALFSFAVLQSGDPIACIKPPPGALRSESASPTIPSAPVGVYCR